MRNHGIGAHGSSRLRHMRFSTLCPLVKSVLLLALLSLPGMAVAEEKSLPAGLDVELALSAADGKKVPAPRLVMEMVKVEGEPVEELLRARRVQPGGDALALIYLLNPGLTQVDPLPSGAALVLPGVPEAEVAQMAPGALVRLSVAPAAKRELLASDLALGPVVERVNLLPAARFEGPDEKEEVIGALDEIRGFLELLNLGITDGKLPLHPEVLRQSLAEARLVKETLEALVKSNKPLAATDRETIVQISEDMNLKARSFDEMRRGEDRPRRWRDARVVVRLKGDKDGAPVSGLRIHYVPRALAGQAKEVRQFSGLGSEVSARLPEASYLVWAAAEGRSTPLSPKVRVDVRRQEGDREMVVDLPVPRN
jgi:hypothetical protein